MHIIYSLYENFRKRRRGVVVFRRPKRVDGGASQQAQEGELASELMGMNFLVPIVIPRYGTQVTDGKSSQAVM